MLDLASLTPDLMSGIAAFTWDVDPVAIKLGPLTFRYYGLLFATALMSGYAILRWQFELEGDDPEEAVKLTYFLIFGVIIGARLGHVFFYEADRYLQDPFEIIKFWKGGLASHGATIGLFAVVGYYVYFMRKMPFRVLSDRLVIGIPLATSAVRLGNFFNSEIVGRATDGPWAVVFPRYDNVPRHPSQLYEVAMGLALFAVIIGIERYYRKRNIARPLGLLTSVFLIGYFSLRFTVEFFKEFQTLNPGSLTMGQYLSLPFVALGLFGLWACLAGPWKGQTAKAFLSPAATPSKPSKNKEEEEDKQPEKKASKPAEPSKRSLAPKKDRKRKRR